MDLALKLIGSKQKANKQLVQPEINAMRYLSKLVMVMAVIFYNGSSFAKNYQIAVQPVLSEKKIIQAYQPLAEYLSKETGHSFTIKTYKNFVTYWERMKKQTGFDFVLDAAHFTDWRVKRQDYMVIAKFPDSVSFSLVTHSDDLVFDADELILKRIATMSSPGLGAVRLNEIYPNPVRIPTYVRSSDAMDAARKVISGQADAAIIPTPMMSQLEDLNLVETTHLVPHMGFSASSKVSKDIAKLVQEVLVDAVKTEDGRKMLSTINIELFQSANNATYDGYAVLLQDVFGY